MKLKTGTGYPLGLSPSLAAIGVSREGNGVNSLGLNNLYCGKNYHLWNAESNQEQRTYSSYLDARVRQQPVYYAALTPTYFPLSSAKSFTNCQNICIRVSTAFGSLTAYVIDRFDAVAVGNDIGLYGRDAWEVVDPGHDLPASVTWSFVACP